MYLAEHVLKFSVIAEVFYLSRFVQSGKIFVWFSVPVVQPKLIALRGVSVQFYAFAITTTAAGNFHYWETRLVIIF